MSNITGEEQQTISKNSTLVKNEIIISLSRERILS